MPNIDTKMTISNNSGSALRIFFTILNNERDQEVHENYITSLFKIIFEYICGIFYHCYLKKENRDLGYNSICQLLSSDQENEPFQKMTCLQEDVQFYILGGGLQPLGG